MALIVAAIINKNSLRRFVAPGSKIARREGDGVLDKILLDYAKVNRDEFRFVYEGEGLDGEDPLASGLQVEVPGVGTLNAPPRPLPPTPDPFLEDKRGFVPPAPAAPAALTDDDPVDVNRKNLEAMSEDQIRALALTRYQAEVDPSLRGKHLIAHVLELEFQMGNQENPED